MNLYKISQSVNTDYDTYDSAVVAAPDGATAKTIHPSGQTDALSWDKRFACWAYDPEQVTARLVGVAVEGTEQGVICASFNAG